MKLKKLTLCIIFILPFLFSCDFKEAKQRIKEKTYFLNEDFVIIDVNENYIDGKLLRTWLINRIETNDNYIEQALLTNKKDACGCNFHITEELWLTKNVDDIIHFDFIRKDRFNKIKLFKEIILVEETKEINEPLIDNYSDNNIVCNKSALERKQLELERQQLSIDRDIEKIEELLNNMN